MTVIAGSFPHRVTIQRHTQEKDAWGTPIPGSDKWELVATCWANVRHLSGSETIKADADISTVRASVRIRWRAGIDAGMRLLHGGQTYDIAAVLPGPNRQNIDLVCKLIQGITT